MFRTGRSKWPQVIASLTVAAGVGVIVGGGCSALLRPPPAGGSGSSGESRATRLPGGGSPSNGARPSRAGKNDDGPPCPDLSDQKAIDDDAWTKDFALQDPDIRTLKAALLAAQGVQSLSTKLDADLKAACAGIVKDLGGKADADSVEAACTAAARAIGDARSRLGASARVNVVYVEPRCAIPSGAISACLEQCGAGSAPAAPRIECAANASVGTCDGKCSGTCDVTEGMVCDGHCRGGCDWGFHGHCDGTCLGSCNGHKSHGFCKGRCSGQCIGLVLRGTCKGRCQGPCELRHGGACPGTCAGRCSSPFKALACEAPRPGAGDAACGARCDAQLAAAAQCSSGRVTVTVDHSRQPARAHRFIETLQQHLPTVLKVAVGLKARATGAARTAQATLQAGDDLVTSAAGRGQAGAALSSCAGAPLRGGLAAIGNLNISVRVAIEVKTAADASDNAGGHPRG